MVRISGVIGLMMAAVACSPVNTVPAPVSPTAPVQHYDLDIPAELEVRSVQFTATTFAEVEGYQGTTGSQVGGRAFVHVHAVHRGTGEQYLLVYEEIARRAAPVFVIRFRAAPVPLSPGVP